MKSLKKDNRGFSLIEVIVSIVVLSLVASALLSGFIQAGRVNQRSQFMQDAADLAQVVAEKFKSMPLEGANGIINMYGTADGVTKTVDTTLDASKGQSLISIEGIKESDILYGSSKRDFKIDVTFDSRPYALSDTDAVISSTYNQSSFLPKVDAEGNPAGIVANAFLVPVMKETQGNIIISAEKYSDGMALDYIKREWAEEYATAVTSSIVDPTTRESEKQYAVDEFTADFDDYFGTERIAASAYSGTTAHNFSGTPNPKRTLQIDVKCKPLTGDNAELRVTVTGIYTFESMTYKGISLSSFTNKEIPLIDDSADYSVASFNKATCADLCDIYFYYNPSDVHHGYVTPSTSMNGSSNDCVIVNFNNGGISLSQDIDFYLISQTVVPAVGEPGETKVILFNGSSLSVNDLGTDKFNLFSNMIYYTGSGYTYCNGSNVNGYITDGGSSDCKIYDMTISVSLNGVEYAKITTTKEE